MNFKYFAHSDITFGSGTIKQLPILIRNFAIRNVMMVYDNGVKLAGIAEKVMTETVKSDAAITVFDKVQPNPTNELVDEASTLAHEKKIDGFIAVGGGSSIDLAKAVNILMTNEGPINRYNGIGLVKKNVLPLIAIPTTAGTSSEITNVSALIDTRKVCKYVIIDNNIVPAAVIADPEFTRTMPASVTAATGMDAITHAIESYISNMATPLTEYSSIKGLQILYTWLPKAFIHSDDMEARENMMLGCIITGFGFSNANLGLVHGIAHALSAHFQLAHGMANAAVLPYVMEFNAESCPQKMIEMAKSLNLPLTGDTKKDRYVLANELKDLTRKLKIKTLSEQGIKESDFVLLADDILKEPVLNFNPRENITREQIIGILQKSF
jgi:alcohol dehydrogenase